MIEIVVFHYHLLPGGVTDVIVNAAVATLDNSDLVGSIHVVCGNVENTERVEERVRKAIPDPEKFTVHVMPEIGYISAERLAELAPEVEIDDEGHNETTFRPVGSPRIRDEAVAAGTEILTERIIEGIVGKYGSSETTERIWWIHNHHIGKNPALTRAVPILISRFPDQRIVLQIHDFPECGRYGNLRFLHRAQADPLYPRGPSVVYGTINSRDASILENASVSPVVYLPNPVSVSSSFSVPKGTEQIREIRIKLIDTFVDRYPLFDPGKTLLLYPVRTIRRKNALEAALLALLMEANIIVSLPGVSAQEKNYSSMVESSFRSGNVPGMWGIGAELEKAGITFEELQQAADAIVSSSVQEGFGFQYVSALLVGKPLIARYLDIMDDVAPLFENYPHAFYREIFVPSRSPSLSNPLPLLGFRYDEHLQRLQTNVGEATARRIRGQIDRKFKNGVIEFSYLLPQMQYIYIKDIKHNPEFREDVQELNQEFLKVAKEAAATPEIPTEVLTPARRALVERLGYEAYAKRLDATISLPPDSTVSGIPATAGIEETEFSILETFAREEFQRLLYE